MQHANDEGDPENNSPPCQPSKYVRFLRSFTLFVIDVILWTCFWPRGTQFGCRTLGIVTTRYILQGIWLLCSYALYGTLLVQSGQEAPTFVSDSTSRLLGLPQQGCRRLKREASLHDIFSTRGDQPGSDEDLDELAHNFLEAIDHAKATYSDEDVISTVGNFAIRTGLDNEPEHADYTVDIRRDVNLKRGMDQAQLEEVRQNIKRNKAIVDEMSENIDKSG